MSHRKELGSKQKKKILSTLFAPGITDKVLKESTQFVMLDEKTERSYILDKQQQISFFSFEEKYIPTLKFIRNYSEIDFPKVVVDEGAVKFVINGADIFTQGIVSCSRKFPENTIVTIVNPQNSVMSIGKSLLSSEDLLKQTGKGIVNIHYLGDKIWKFE